MKTGEDGIVSKPLEGGRQMSRRTIKRYIVQWIDNISHRENIDTAILSTEWQLLPQKPSQCEGFTFRNKN